MENELSNNDLEAEINGLYILFCSLLLSMIICGISLFYSGITQRRSSFTMLAIPLFLLPFIMIDWFIWGYSLCYSTSSNKFIGDMNFVVLRHLRDPKYFMYETPRGSIYSINHFIFNGIMKAVCAALTFPGCIAERGRILPMLVFFFFWSCFIYNPVSYWLWNENGWLSVQTSNLPVLDFAGGTCIHIVSGFTVFAYSYLLGPRNPKILQDYQSSNNGFIIFGTFLMLCGWCGFIAGCDYKFSTTCISIIVTTLLCGFTSGIIWLLIDFYFSAIPLDGTISESVENSINENNVHNGSVEINQEYEEPPLKYRRNLSMISLTSGIITGLVVITPGGGYVSSTSDYWKSIIFGIVGAIIVNLSTRLKYFFKIDDSLDIFAIHGVAGIVGSILTGIFAVDGYDSKGGWVEGHWVQIAYQILGCVVAGVYVTVLSIFFLLIINQVPGLHLRMDKHFNSRSKNQEAEHILDIESTYYNNFHMRQEDSMSEGEKYEIMGSDIFEFGEHLMDFMQIKTVLIPELSDNIPEEIRNYINKQFNSYASDFQLHEGDVRNISKLE